MTNMIQEGASAAAFAIGTDFVFGVNVAWFGGANGYAHDLGLEPENPSWDVWYNPTAVSECFRDIKNIGFNVVRFWLFERGEGLVVDKDGIITHLHDGFLRNLDDLVGRARNEGLLLYLCFTNTWKELKTCPSPVQVQHQQNAYLDLAVRPITQMLKESPTIWAFDIFNEIESEILDTDGYVVSEDEAKIFVKNNVAAIKSEDMGRRVSCGSGWRGWDSVKEGRYLNLGLDFYDIHVYRNDGYLPHVTCLNVDKPVVVGECGPIATDDESQRSSVLAFLNNAVVNKYAGCFVWAYGPEMRGLELVREGRIHRPVVAEIRHFIQRHSASS